jgi:hypothetical protein
MRFGARKHLESAFILVNSLSKIVQTNKRESTLRAVSIYALTKVYSKDELLQCSNKGRVCLNNNAILLAEVAYFSTCIKWMDLV